MLINKIDILTFYLKACKILIKNTLKQTQLKNNNK